MNVTPFPYLTSHAWNPVAPFPPPPPHTDGTVHLRQRERIYFSYLITLKPTAGTAKLKVGTTVPCLGQDTTTPYLAPSHTHAGSPPSPAPHTRPTPASPSPYRSKCFSSCNPHTFYHFLT